MSPEHLEKPKQPIQVNSLQLHNKTQGHLLPACLSCTTAKFVSKLFKLKTSFTHRRYFRFGPHTNKQVFFDYWLKSLKNIQVWRNYTHRGRDEQDHDTSHFHTSTISIKCKRSTYLFFLNEWFTEKTCTNHNPFSQPVHSYIWVQYWPDFHWCSPYRFVSLLLFSSWSTFTLHTFTDQDSLQIQATYNLLQSKTLCALSASGVDGGPWRAAKRGWGRMKCS